MPAATWWQAPVGGEAPDLPPDQLSSAQARRLRNFLVDNPGQIIPRGTIGGAGALDTGSLVDTTSGGALLGTAVSDDTVAATFRLPNATPQVDYWRVPINRPTIAGDLSQPTLAGEVVDLTTGVHTTIPVGAALSVFGPSVCRVDQALYSASFGGVSTAIPTGVAPLNAIRKVVIGGAGAVLTNGPRFVQAVFSHGGRVWAAAAREPGGADYDTSAIWYTIPGGTTALTDVVTDWQDPETGEFNRFSIGAANDGDFTVGFGRAAGQLVVFKRNAVYVLYGTEPSNFTLRQLRTQSGCVDLRSICVADEGTYFASQLGYELFDGNTFHLLSRPVQKTWQDLSNAGVASGTVNHAYIRADPLPNGYLHLALGTDSTTANADDGTERGWLLHRASGAWTDLHSGITSLKLSASGHFNRFVMTRAFVIAMGAAKWARCDRVTYGPVEMTGVRDIDAGASYDMDLIWTTSVDNMGSYRHLDGKWITNTLQHMTVDYHQHFVDPGPAELTSFGSLRGEDGFGQAMFGEQDVPGYQLPGPLRTRQMYDVKWESNRGDVSLTLQTTTGSDAALRTAQLNVYGIGVAFEHGRERHVA